MPTSLCLSWMMKTFRAHLPSFLGIIAVMRMYMRIFVESMNQNNGVSVLLRAQRFSKCTELMWMWPWPSSPCYHRADYRASFMLSRLLLGFEFPCRCLLVASALIPCLSPDAIRFMRVNMTDNFGFDILVVINMEEA